MHDQHPTHVTIGLSSSPAAHHTAVAVTNASIGHATLLRIAAMFQPDGSAGGEDGGDSAEEPAPPPPEQHAAAPALEAPAEPPRASTVAVELHDCRVTWKYQPAAARACHMPAALQDFLSLHEDVVRLDVPHFHLALPFLPDGEGDADGEVAAFVEGERTLDARFRSRPAAASSSNSNSSSNSSSPGGGGGGSSGSLLGAEGEAKLLVVHNLSVSIATVGYLGRPSLPVVQIPQLTLVRSAPGAEGEGAPPEGAGTAHRLHLAVPSLDVGIHPSHLVTAAAAVQLYQQEMALLMREPADASTGKWENALGVSVPCCAWTEVLILILKPFRERHVQMRRALRPLVPRPTREAGAPSRRCPGPPPGQLKRPCRQRRRPRGPRPGPSPLLLPPRNTPPQPALPGL